MSWVSTGAPGFAQHAVDATQRYHRLICLVHLNGSGKKGDEIKPDYVPSDITSRDGIIAWSMQVADDGKMAIVQYVAVNRHAFDAILADKRPEVQVLEIGVDNPKAIEGELKKFRKERAGPRIQLRQSEAPDHAAGISERVLGF